MGERDWVLGHAGFGPAVVVSGGMDRPGHQALKPVTDVELTRLRAVERAAREVVSSYDYDYTHIKEEIEALRTALGEAGEK